LGEQALAIWHVQANIADLNARSTGTIVEHIGIEFLEIGDDYLKARMPVDARTIQPAGILHGGASVVLAETLGSVAALLCEDPDKKHCVGLEVNANHVRSVRSGYVYGVAKPLHIGSSTQIWEITISNEEGRLVCVARLTLAVLSKG
jgi:1,4-dihydroxy-2-naphthoyl-CoA hydrolase